VTNISVGISRRTTSKEITHAAAAPSISCRLALVNNERTAENTNVATKRMPMHTAFDLVLSTIPLARYKA